VADNVTINTGTGPTIWTDQIGTRHAQVVKIALGATDTGNYLITGQTNMTNSIPVVFASDQTILQVTGTAFTVASITTGTMSVVNVLSAANVTVASVTTGTMNVINVLSASGVTVASIATGTVTVLPGVLLAATTASIGAVVGTAHASRFDAYAVNTTSGASVIVRTSGAHTIYITDMVLSVDVPSRVDIFSAATTKMSLYLATKGGFAVGLSQPMVLNSNQSLTFTPSASGSAMMFVTGYTVT
jgi:hypothetical protein